MQDQIKFRKYVNTLGLIPIGGLYFLPETNLSFSFKEGNQWTGPSYIMAHGIIPLDLITELCEELRLYAESFYKPKIFNGKDVNEYSRNRELEDLTQIENSAQKEILEKDGKNPNASFCYTITLYNDESSEAFKLIVKTAFNYYSRNIDLKNKCK